MAEEERPAAAITRRHLIQATGAAACAAAAGGAVVLSADFLRPRALFEPPTRFTAGPPEAIAVGEVITNELYHAYVIHGADGFRALSSVCTHLGCVTRHQPGSDVISCPCHGSRFALDGSVLAGPAPSPLPSLQMTISERGEIAVDTASVVPPGTVFRL